LSSLQAPTCGTLVTMSFGHSALRGFPVTGTGGRVEYRLARNAVVSEFHKGRLSKLDVCDAHPELIAGGPQCGRTPARAMPHLRGPPLVHVTYVFGPRLPSHGRCPTSATELSRLCRRADEVVCYVVEVCPDCAWNHLARMYPAGGRHRASASAARRGNG